MQLVSLAVAFVLGFIMRLVGLPPLLGFLAAGFALQVIGVEDEGTLHNVSDLGVLLLLFTIGLKLNVRSLFKKPVLVGGSMHMGLTILFFFVILSLLSLLGMVYLTDLTFVEILIITLALSFSSTVFAVKVLEDKGEMRTMLGRTSIGILIIQDIIAVLFLTFSKGEWPSPWALLLLGLPLLRPMLIWLMKKSGHGEMLILYGFLLALVGAEVFRIAGLKADLGALVIGLIVANSAKSEELAKTLLNFKDFFLVAFFLSIGLSGQPEWWMVGVAVGLTLVLPLKGMLFFWILTRFRLRARTSFLSSLVLANYSEFGLIVMSVAVVNGWVSNDWILVFAIALSFSFLIGYPLNTSLYFSKFEKWLLPFESKNRLPEDAPIVTDGAKILIFGMGKIGARAYDYMNDRFPTKVLALDADWYSVEKHQSRNRNVILGDASDSDFWDKLKPGNIDLVILAMKNHSANRIAAQRLQRSHFSGRIAAIAHYDDELRELMELGVDDVFNLYAEAGTGFAEHVCERFEKDCAIETLAETNEDG
jgi:predicted Kef-type K+ transport protein